MKATRPSTRFLSSIDGLTLIEVLVACVLSIGICLVAMQLLRGSVSQTAQQFTESGATDELRLITDAIAHDWSMRASSIAFPAGFAVAYAAGTFSGPPALSCPQVSNLANAPCQGLVIPQTISSTGARRVIRYLTKWETITESADMKWASLPPLLPTLITSGRDSQRPYVEVATWNNSTNYPAAAPSSVLKWPSDQSIKAVALCFQFIDNCVQSTGQAFLRDAGVVATVGALYRKSGVNVSAVHSTVQLNFNDRSQSVQLLPY